MSKVSCGFFAFTQEVLKGKLQFLRGGLNGYSVCNQEYVSQ